MHYHENCSSILIVSYQGGTDLEARLRSGSTGTSATACAILNLVIPCSLIVLVTTEERGPRERSEMVSGNTANAKSS